MGRGLLFVTSVVALAAALGCWSGTSDVVKNAPAAKPVNLGNPGSLAMGVTPYLTTHFIVKEQIDGETRIYALSSGGRGVKVKSLKYDAETKAFVEQGTDRKYDIEGKALQAMVKGPKKGKPGLPLDRYKVTLDPKTGDLLLTEAGKIKLEFHDNKERGAYVVVP